MSRTTSNSPAWKRVHFAARSCGVSVTLVTCPLRLPRVDGRRLRADDRHPVVGQHAADVGLPLPHDGVGHEDDGPAAPALLAGPGQHGDAGVGLADAHVEGEQARPGWRAGGGRRRPGGVQADAVRRSSGRWQRLRPSRSGRRSPGSCGCRRPRCLAPAVVVGADPGAEARLPLAAPSSAGSRRGSGPALLRPEHRLVVVDPADAPAGLGVESSQLLSM